MRVWLVGTGGREDFRIVGVFSSENAASYYCAKNWTRELYKRPFLYATFVVDMPAGEAEELLREAERA